MKKLLLLLFALVFLVSCTVISQRNPDPYQGEEKLYSPPAQEGQIQRTALYFLNGEENRLQSEYRSIVATTDDIAVATLNELALGTDNGALRAVIPTNVKLTGVEIVGGTANVHYDLLGMLDAKTQYIMCRAVANTLIDLLDIQYANIFFNGTQQLLNGEITGAYNMFVGNFAGDITLGDTRSVTLYYANGEKLTAKTEEISESYPQEMVKKLFRGLKLVNNPDVEGEVMDLYFSGNENYLNVPALTVTFTRFFPGVKKIRIWLNNLYRGEYIEETFSHLVGSQVKVYCVQGEKLALNEIWMHAKDYFSLTKRLDVLFQNSSYDLSLDDIVFAKYYGETALVNLKKEFRDKCADFTSEEETLLIYSMVNTLCEMTGVKEVLFLVEGDISYISGHIYTKRPLLKNPGLTKK